MATQQRQQLGGRKLTQGAHRDRSARLKSQGGHIKGAQHHPLSLGRALCPGLIGSRASSWGPEGSSSIPMTDTQGAVLDRDGKPGGQCA